MTDKPVKKPTPKISPRVGTSASVTASGSTKVEPAAPAVAPAPAVVAPAEMMIASAPTPEPVKPPPVHPSQAVVNDDGKKDYREKIKDGERNEATGEPIVPKAANPVVAAEETIMGEARSLVMSNFARIWGHLSDGPPDLFPLVTIEDTVLSRNMVTGGYTVTGPKNGRVEFTEGEEFDMLECFRTNAQMSSHTAEMKKRQVGLARRLIP